MIIIIIIRAIKEPSSCVSYRRHIKQYREGKVEKKGTRLLFIQTKRSYYDQDQQIQIFIAHKAPFFLLTFRFNNPIEFNECLGRLKSHFLTIINPWAP